MSNDEKIAKAFKELGHITRVQTYKHIIRAGKKGISVGSLQEKLQIPHSTLSHHISSLVSAGLIVQDRVGRTLLCKVSHEMHENIVDFFQNECCIADDENTLIEIKLSK